MNKSEHHQYPKGGIAFGDDETAVALILSPLKNL